jgi:hypothetical protein
MPDQREAQPDDPLVTIERTEAAILEMLVRSEAPGLWSVAELGLEFGGELAAIDAVGALHRAGLVHRTNDGFVFATRAAVRASELRL